MARIYRTTEKPGFKVCNRCNKELPANPDVFLRDKSRKDGLAYECRKCHSIRKKGRDNRPDRWSLMTPEQKKKVRARQNRYAKTPKGRAIFMLKAYQRIDKAKGQECDLSKDFLINEIFSNPCTYCGETEKIGCDRIDNELPHTKANVVPCCPTCNIARGDNFTHEEMLLLGKTIAAIKSARLDGLPKEAENEARPEKDFHCASASL